MSYPTLKNDGELAQAFVNGEDWAFSKVYGRYQKPVLRYLLHKVGDREAARDLAQEIFLKAHRFRASYDPTYAISSWLWAIARNTVLDWRRERRPEASHREGVEDDLVSPDPNAEALLAGASDRAALRRLMRTLTVLQRKVLWMRIIHQLSYAEISKRLGLSLSAVKCLAYRSRMALQEMTTLPELTPRFS